MRRQFIAVRPWHCIRPWGSVFRLWVAGAPASLSMLGVVQGSRQVGSPCSRYSRRGCCSAPSFCDGHSATNDDAGADDRRYIRSRNELFRPLEDIPETGAAMKISARNRLKGTVTQVTK